MDGQSGRTFTQRIETTGGELVDRVRELAREADTRRVVIKDQSGKELMRLPLTWGMAGGAVAVLTAPLLAVVAAVGGAMAKVRLEVERVGPPDPPRGSATGGTGRDGWVEDDPTWSGHGTDDPRQDKGGPAWG